jgi:SAM-dependent methyltransferase
MDLVRPDDTVLDVGCGPGLMAPELGRMLGPDGKYVGLDIQRASVRWCRERFRREGRFRFEVVDAGGSGFPVADWSGGFILAKSVFTHLTEKQARACLTEIRRALAPGRTAMITGFLFNGAAGGSRSAPYFPFSNADGTVRWRWRTRPSSAITFDRAMFEGLIEGCGLRVALFRPGFWPGAAEPTGQDTLFLVHREAGISSARCDAAKTP